VSVQRYTKSWPRDTEFEGHSSDLLVRMKGVRSQLAARHRMDLRRQERPAPKVNQSAAVRTKSDSGSPILRMLL